MSMELARSLLQAMLVVVSVWIPFSQYFLGSIKEYSIGIQSLSLTFIGLTYMAISTALVHLFFYLDPSGQLRPAFLFLLTWIAMTAAFILTVAAKQTADRIDEEEFENVHMFLLDEITDVYSSTFLTLFWRVVVIPLLMFSVGVVLYSGFL